MNPPLLDQAGALRDGDAVDVARVVEWLRGTRSDLPGGTAELRQFPGGASNLTFQLRLGEWTAVLRRPPPGTKPKSGHDMAREYRVLSHLRPHFPVPQPLAYCDDESVIGAPFYLMEQVEGVILRRDPPEDARWTPATAQQLGRRLFDTLVALHTLDYQGAGLADLGRPSGYVQRQVGGWCERYQRARTEDVPTAEALMTWLAEHMPPDSPVSALIHNDYRLDNVVLDPADLLGVRAVLDWEMCTIGDPLMDFGNSLAYWVQADDPAPLQALRVQLSNAPGMMTRAQVVDYYAQRTGWALTHLVFYYAFGVFRLAAILQQIYLRWTLGQSRNPRFGTFGESVRTLIDTAERVIQRGSI